MLYTVLASKKNSTGKSYLKHKPPTVTDNLRSSYLGNSHKRSMPKTFEHFPTYKIKLKSERPEVTERAVMISNGMS